MAKEREVRQLTTSFIEKLLKDYMKGKYTIAEFTQKINEELIRGNYTISDRAELKFLRVKVTKLEKQLNK